MKIINERILFQELCQLLKHKNVREFPELFRLFDMLYESTGEAEKVRQYEQKCFEEREQKIIIEQMKIRKRALELEKTMRCQCNLDRWRPEPDTGHSWACPIHKAAMEAGGARHSA